MTGFLLLLLSIGGILSLLFALRRGVVPRWRARQASSDRALAEDGLKHLLLYSLRGQPATHDSLAGSLRLPAKKLVRLLARMEAGGMIHSTAGHIELQPEGERRAREIVRAHRLWERYLADELRTPLEKIHSEAERAEHRLSRERMDALEAHLGHPLRDPHGDPIPLANGSIAEIQARQLTDCFPEEKVEIVHLEDEPEFLLDQILELGLKPGLRLQVLETSSEAILVWDGERRLRLSRPQAANIHVRPAPDLAVRPAGAIPLDQLPEFQPAEVVDIDPEFRGLARRRLLDLGLTPSATVVAELTTPFGDPRAYRVRGTLVALRRDQAEHVWVRPKGGLERR